MRDAYGFSLSQVAFLQPNVVCEFLVHLRAGRHLSVGVARADEFWNEVNQPFLDQAISRGDNIVLVTKPTDSALNRTLPDGTVVRSGFGREYDYLQQHGYTYDSATSAMIKR